MGKTTNDYAKNRTVRGKGNTASSLKYRVTVDDKTDTGSVMDTERPMTKGSPYMDISANWDSVNKKGGLNG
jgi:hypothetical protein